MIRSSFTLAPRDAQIPSQQNFHCVGGIYDTGSTSLVPTNDTFALVAYEAITNVTKTEPQYKNLASCCAPNEVHKIEGDCLIWCVLPPDAVDDIDRFRDCFQEANVRSDQYSGYAFTIEEEGEGVSAVGHPNLFSVLLLTTLLCAVLLG